MLQPIVDDSTSPAPLMDMMSTPSGEMEPQTASTNTKEPSKVAESQAGKMYNFAFEGAPLDLVMEEYCRWTDKIYLKTDDVKASITLKSHKLLPIEEGIKVVEAILAMHNVALVPMGDDYIKVVHAASGDLVGQGLPLNTDMSTELIASDEFITQIIPLKNVEIPEVEAAVQHVLHAYGKIMSLQRSNSLMITDTAANVKRAMEIIDFIDKATAQLESRIYTIKHSNAQEISEKLNEIVTAAQGDQQQSNVPTPRSPPGVIRARTTARTPTQASIGQTEEASTTIIQGTVKILADDRTNIIIIFSQKENFPFFEQIIKVLDIEVEAATTFEVVNLEYADADELSETLNSLISGSSGSSGSKSSSSSSKKSGPGGPNSPNSRITPNSVPQAATTIENLNRLSEDTKVLADARSNSIILMGRKSDIAAIKQVIRSLDVMLEQVVIEAAIFEIGLTDSLRHGIDWIYQSIDGNKVSGWDGSSLAGTNSGIGSVASGALTYYQNLTGLDSQILINLAASDNDSRLVSTPVIMTTDNTEASLSVGEQRPVVTSTSSFANSSGTQSSNYEYKDIGIQLTVKPRINPQRFVVMELTQQADQLGGSVTIDNNEVPIILNRQFEASIAVPDGGTVVLGGLVSSETEDSVTKIPILGDIPLIGRYLFSSVKKEEVQRELIVLLTPYVVSDNTEMLSQTERLYKGAGLKQENWGGNNWSESPLRLIPDPVPVAETEDEQEK